MVYTNILKIQEHTKTLSENNLKLKQSNTELDTIKVQLEDVAQERIEFLAKLSHELRTPVHIEQAMIKLLIENHQNLEFDKHFQSLTRMNANLSMLINDILDITIIDAGKVSIQNKKFDLYQLVEQTIEAVNNLALKKDLILELCFDQNINLETIDLIHLRAINSL